MTSALTADRIARALGRGLVRATYPAGIDDGEPMPAVITLRIKQRDGQLVQLFYRDDPRHGPMLTDFGAVLSSLHDAGERPPLDQVRELVAAAGVHIDENDHSLWTEISSGIGTAEDAAELVVAVAMLIGLSYAIPPPAKKRGRRK